MIHNNTWTELQKKKTNEVISRNDLQKDNAIELIVLEVASPKIISTS